MNWIKLVKAKAMPKGKKIEYEDDLVIVYNEEGSIIYKGLEDYEPMRYENWKWNEEKQYYTLGNDYIKGCLDI